jgi:catechol 2,3-dioxygenase-like lactoylglutathione lyase family enzyme
MPLHALTRITIGVPDVGSVAAYYEDFGLVRESQRGNEVRMSTVDGGDQLSLVSAARRQLIEMQVGVDNLDDLDRITANLRRLDLAPVRSDVDVTSTDPGTGVRACVVIAPRLQQSAVSVPTPNAPGAIARPSGRAPSIERDTPVRPRKLGHVVVGSTDHAASERFFVEGIGFKVSDRVPGMASFIRCSTDHHNLLIQAAPVNVLHHSSWQVDDVDEVGRGATAMLAQDPARHVWGLGRHHIGSNFFWYLKDPAGNFSEYYSDLDCIIDDQLWTPQDWEDSRALYSWGPPPPASFLHPEDLAELMTASHGA